MPVKLQTPYTVAGVTSAVPPTIVRWAMQDQAHSSGHSSTSGFACVESQGVPELTMTCNNERQTVSICSAALSMASQPDVAVSDLTLSVLHNFERIRP